MQENKPNAVWRIFTDGAIDPARGISGLAAVVRRENGEICHWWNRRAGRLTCNEAEYAAAIFAFEKLLALPTAARPARLVLCSDSQVMVNQMNGSAEAHSPALNRARARLRTLVARCPPVEFQHIFREQNRLADALAYDAVAPQVDFAAPGERKPRAAAVGAAGRQLLETWGLQ